MDLKSDIVIKFLQRENMCLAIPGKIISINNTNPNLKIANVNFSGVVKEICIQWLDDVKIDDYVIVHAGFALNKIDVKEAEATLLSLKEFGSILDKENLQKDSTL